MFALLKPSPDSSVPSEAVSWQQELVKTTNTHPQQQQQQQPSFLDRLAAPTVFLQQALLFDTSLDSRALKAAVASAVDQYPPFGYRLTSDKDGQLLTVPCSPAGSSGVAFLQGHTSSLTLQQLSTQPAASGGPSTTSTALSPSSGSVSSSSSTLLQTPELPDLLFSHLPGSLTPDYLSTDLPLVHVALLQLQEGGSLLGVRMSHLLGDWTSLRLLLRHLAAAYTAAAATAGGGGETTAANASTQQQQGEGQHLQEGVGQAVLVPAAPLLNQLATAVHQQQAAAGSPWSPVRLKPLQQADTDTFSKLAALSSGSSSAGSSSNQRPVRLSYYVPPGRVQQLRQQLLAEEAAPAAHSSSSSSDGSWCTAHNALLASVLKAFGGLPGRQGLPHDVSVAADMRGRLPQQQLQLLGQQEGQALARAVGNFFASAIAEDCVAQQCSRAELAQALHAAVQRASEVWLPDLAWAAGVKGMTAAAAAAAANDPPAEGAVSSAGVVRGEVTWRRLHAMGPTALLQQQMGLGLLASLSTTQWPLRFQEDAAFVGQLPSLSVPSFSQPQPYPLVLMQQATLAQGGGWMVHLFLDACEAPAMQAAVEMQGGI